ncbi:MAG: hypothetical protein V4591_03500 [Bdellovibrionota bacterium]
MQNQKIIENIFAQQKILIQKIPNLQHYFIPILIPEWKTTLPFLPIRCFRDFNLHSNFSEETAHQYKIFLSSGSTGNKQARHIFSIPALENYEQQTCNGFLAFLKRNQLNKATPIISLVPHQTTWPTSSLAAMIEMFAKNNFKMNWCDINAQKEILIEILKTYPDRSPCLIFGTTFHHLMLADNTNLEFRKSIQTQFQRLNIFIVDTGGTKGRTQALTREQSVEKLRSFYTSPNFAFFSEYGMCELSSQAWSAQKIHDGSFIANETLIPLCISIEKKTTLSHEEKGFIAFIDTVNTESWQSIITEDVGYTITENAFHLLGRGPDASIKGCSLNVRNFFNFADKSEKELINSKSQNSKINLNQILTTLKEKYLWDTFSIADFQATASSIENKIPLDRQYSSKNLFIISAANTPIAWLFPFLIAANSGASSITIKIPSLRLDDYFVEKIIEKTKNLICLFAQYFPNTKTYIDTNKSIAHNFSQYDIVLVFGTNETCQTIANQIDLKKTVFIGKGDVKNSLTVDIKKDNSIEIAKLCSIWNGRGCLTPVVLFCEGSQNEIYNWAHNFAKNLEKQFLERFECNKIDLIQHIVHAHSCAYIRGQIEQLGLSNEKYIFRGSLTCVVNLTEAQLEPEFNFGGFGFVYLLPSTMQNKFTELSEINVLPSICDTL